MKVLARSTHLLMGLGEKFDCLTATITPLFPTRDPALRPLQIQLGHAEDARVGNLAAIRQGGERFQAEIDARLLASEREGLR
jgi:hypothetical protein